MTQFYTFLVCILMGASGGAAYDLVSLLRLPFRMKWVGPCLDVLFCLVFAAGYLAVSAAMELPSLRLYTFAGCLAGFALYLKSLHKILAFVTKKLYNRIKLIRKEQRICPKGKRVLQRKK